MMTQEELDTNVHELIALKNEYDNLSSKIDAIKNLIKVEMEERGEYILSGDDWRVSWEMVQSKRFDQSEFKADNPDLFHKYTKLSEARRFLY